MKDLRELSRIDLNLLVVFHALYENRHVTRAASHLRISQPALSHSLKRLRDTLDDDVFVKTPKGMVPTNRANTLAPIIKNLLERIDQTVLKGKTWNLSSEKRIFRIQSTDLIEHLLLPKLIEALQVEATATSVAFTTARFSLPKEDLETGVLDLAIAGFFGDLPAGFFRQKVFSDVFQVAVRSKHPRLGKKTKLSIEDLKSENHLIIAPGGELSGHIDRVLSKMGSSRRIIAGLSTFMGSGSILAETDCVLFGPSIMFRSFSNQLNLKAFTSPIDLPHLQIIQVWHDRNHHDSHHKWLREEVYRVLSEQTSN